MPSARIPYDLHEGHITKHSFVDEETKQPVVVPGFAGLTDAMALARQQSEALANAYDAVMADQTLTPEGRAAKVRGLIATVARRVTAKLESARSDALAAVETLKASIAVPRPATAEEAAARREFRDRFLALKEASRPDTLIHICNHGRDEVVHALMQDSFLIDMKPDAHAVLVERWQHRRFPKETKSIKALEAAIKSYDHGGKGFVTFANELAASPAMKLAEQASQRTADAVAAVDAAE